MKGLNTPALAPARRRRVSRDEEAGRTAPVPGKRRTHQHRSRDLAANPDLKENPAAGLV